jgi:ribose/xylose/arabinose/galactoside ABC-type transport system permease subunit
MSRISATAAGSPHAGGPVAGLEVRRNRWLTAGGEVRRNAIVLALAWVILITATTIHRSDFLAHRTIVAVAFTMAVTGVLAVGMSLVTISGGFLDLSVPAALVLPALLVAHLLQHGAATATVVVVAGAAGVAWGVLNAAIVVFGRVNPLIVTLGTNFAGVGALNLLFDQQVMPLDAPLRSFGRSQVLGLPSVWWVMLAVTVLATLLLGKTRGGRHVVAVGGNATAAARRGISVRRVRFTVFVLAGLCAAIAALLLVAQSSAVTPADGSSFLLPVVAATILGGVSLTGGRGELLVLLLSGGFLATVPTALVFFGLSTYWQQVMQGAVLMIAVSLDGWRRKKARSR